jgi:hypothetical protein
MQGSWEGQCRRIHTGASSLKIPATSTDGQLLVPKQLPQSLWSRVRNAGAGGRGNPRDPRRNGLDGSQNQARPRPVSLSNDMLRLATLAVAQIARQSLRQAQATSLPAMATAVAAVQEQAFQDTVQAASIQVGPYLD